MVRLILILSLIFNIIPSERVWGDIGRKAEISSETLFNNSLKAFKDKRWEEAVGGFEYLLNNGEGAWRKRSIFMLARAYLGLGKWEDARDLFLRAIPEYEELTEYSLYGISESFLAERDYERALEILRLLYHYGDGPLKGLAQFKEAETLYISGKYRDAIKAFENFISENTNDPAVPTAKLYKAKALKRIGMIEEAIGIFKALWTGYPVSTIAKKAKEELATTRLGPEDYLARAENLLKVSSYTDAIGDLQKAIELEKNPLRVNEIRLKIGISLFKARRYEEAIGVLSKFLQVSREALYYTAKAYLRKGDRDSFLKASDEFYRLYPEDRKTPELLLIAADELRRSGDREKALSIYNLIMKEYSRISDDALYQRGWMEYLSGDIEKGLSDMRSLIENHPRSPKIPQALYWEARGYDKSGERAKAEEIYRKIVKISPSTFYGYLAIERLKGAEGFMKIATAFPSLRSGPRLSFSEIPFPKVRELNILGMKEEAVAELDYLRDRYSDIIQTVHKPEAPEILIKIGEAYISLGKYRMAISMAEGYSGKEKRLNYLSYPLGFWPFLSKSSDDTMIDPYLLAALIREESRFDPEAVSKRGAKGLMQVITSTWDWIQKQRDKSEISNIDPFDPEENISRGSWYLRYLLDRFDQNLIAALSAYNAGPEVVTSWIKNGPKEADEFIEEIPYPETKAYIKRVLRSYGMYRMIYTDANKGIQ